MILRSSKKTCSDAVCGDCRSDQAFLRRKHRPKATEPDSKRIRAVDLFAGCGGMSVGLQEAARRQGCALEIPLAVDLDREVMRVYGANLPQATRLVVDISDLFDGLLGEDITPSEQRIEKTVGDVDILVGGPPCQGHSDLNNHTRRNDPKNDLYLVMARAAEVLLPKIVVIENVVPVLLDEAGVVDSAKKALIGAGYHVAGKVIDLRHVGVPQRRRRFLLLASRIPEIDPTVLLAALTPQKPEHPDRSVRWAIEDLMSTTAKGTYDQAGIRSEKNTKRIAYLFEKGLYDLPNSQRPACHRDRAHTYMSMYGRLRWDSAAQTITTGFGSMGQGRYVHPAVQRTITPHEAARLQTFPDWFDFGAETPRGVLSKMIGNAVPPLLMVTLGGEIVRRLRSLEAIRNRS